MIRGKREIYKCNAKQILESKPYAEVPRLRKELCDALKIGAIRLSQLLNTKVGDKGSWSIDQLIIVAKVLGCKLDDLLPIIEEEFAV